MALLRFFVVRGSGGQDFLEVDTGKETKSASTTSSTYGGYGHSSLHPLTHPPPRAARTGAHEPPRTESKSKVSQNGRRVRLLPSLFLIRENPCPQAVYAVRGEFR